MNRVFVYGVALFFAIVGIALLGGEKTAVAGHGCNGCHGAVACDGAGAGCAAVACQGRCFGRARHHARARCGGCEGRRMFGRRRCAGQATDCCGVQPVDCCGTAAAAVGTPTEAHAHEAPPTEEPGGAAPAAE